MKKRRDIITIGFALFAMFFGAGNLLLPPYLGMLVGDNYLITIFAFALTGILLPFMGIIAVSLSGDYIEDMSKWVNRPIITILGTVIMLAIGPLIAIPRTAATTFEVGIQPMFADFSPIWASVLFFAVTFLLSISSSKVVDIIGKYLTPILLIVLVALVIVGLVNPLAPTEEISQNFSNSFSLGFIEGYQTLDVLASLVFAGVIIAATKAKGYTSISQKFNVVSISGAIASLCLLFIYGGLVYLGATSGIYDPDIKRANLLLHIAQSLLGKYGTIAIAICIAFACLTTAIALTSAFGTFFSKLLNEKISYKVLVTICCILSAMLSIIGVDDIITYAYPFLTFIYPIAITLVIYVIAFGRKVRMRPPYIGALAGTTVFSLVSVLISLFPESQHAFYSIQKIPLYGFEMGWLLPSVIGFIVGFLFSKSKRVVE